MPTIVGVRLRNAPRPALVDTGGTQIGDDEIVIVDAGRGPEAARVVQGPREPGEGEAADTSVRMLRAASDEDLRTIEGLHRREKDAMPVYRRLVAKHGLEMKPVDVEYLLDGNRMVFYFAAEERVDFRDLVRDLAAEFHARIDMRQIGVRDEARMIGGLGHCGEQLCCVRLGGEFQPVSIRMAKEQDLPLNPLKISGLCGRLMCCLRYEFDAYKDFKGRAPRKGAIVEVGEQKGKVVDFNTPKETVTMRLEEGGSLTVALADMDCASGGACPCRVRAEALERQTQSLSAAVASVANISSSPSSPPAKAGEENAGEAAGERSGRRRRRRSSGGGAESQQGRGAKAADGGGSGGSGAQRASKPQAPKGGQTAQAKQPEKGQQPAGGTSGRRRRRRRSGGGGAPAAPSA